MKRGSTIILRAVVIFIGLVALATCIFGLPRLIMSEMATGADFDYGPIFLGLYIPAIPFFYALYQAIRLLRFIDKNQAFSNDSVRAFRNIKYCAFIISGFFSLGMPYVFQVADRDDAPGVVALGLVIIGASFVIGTFSAVMLKLVQNAVDIKSENDLTV
jgi:hypothetical protein